jgi:formylglycine-generating enzyme required for sulfatase activity
VQAIEANASGIREDVPQETLYFTFIVFPPDEYDMGSPENELDHVQKERLHRVRLTKPLAVSDRELMWEQFDAFMPRIRMRREDDHSRTFASDEAVSGVSWFEAVRYCRWLTRQAHPTDAESKQCFVDDASLEKDEKGNPISWPLELHRGGFRLLTEAEWEYVCRSGTRTAFSFGSDLQWLDRYGCFQGNSKGWSHRTGSLRPNLRGMFDLHGNLWEWCYDWHGEYSEDLQDPTGPESGAYRVGRGGSWVREATQTRSANRARNTPDFRNRDLGFRIAFTLPDE